VGSRGMVTWVRSYGFATLVLLAIAAAVFLAIRTEVPEPVPDFALRATAIYRIEVGLCSFLGFYLVCLLFVSALNGRGVTQFGREGVQVQQIVDQPQRAKARGFRALLARWKRPSSGRKSR
jgi:hypothetical protein